MFFLNFINTYPTSSRPTCTETRAFNSHGGCHLFFLFFFQRQHPTTRCFFLSGTDLPEKPSGFVFHVYTLAPVVVVGKPERALRKNDRNLCVRTQRSSRLCALWACAIIGRVALFYLRVFFCYSYLTRHASSFLFYISRIARKITHHPLGRPSTLGFSTPGRTAY